MVLCGTKSDMMLRKEMARKAEKHLKKLSGYKDMHLDMASIKTLEKLKELAFLLNKELEELLY